MFLVTADRAVLILDVIPDASRLARWLSPGLFNDSQLARRRSFYGTDTPETVPFEEMIDTYKMLAEKSGYIVDWWFTQRRTLFLYFLVIQISRIKNVTRGSRS